MRPNVLYRQFEAEPSLHKNHGNTGIQAQRQAEASAAHASFMLAERCRRVIHDFAAEHRISLDDARILLLETGVRL